MNISQVASALSAEFRGQDATFLRISTDTRALREGDLFVALVGENFDAHDFLVQAKSAGACAALVSRWVSVDMPQIKVEDTRTALGAWASHFRSMFDVRIVAVTGSCGKTSVKEMIAAILAEQGKVLATDGNLNNDIGAPLTLLRLCPEHEFAVIELGANHAGEIAYTATLTKPDVALITNVGDAHLEGFGSRVNIARAKAEIYSGLKPGGVAVINLDDEFSDYWLDINRERRCRTFSLSKESADIYATSWQLDDFGRPSMQVSVDGVLADVTLNVLGKHQILNALAALAATTSLGCDVQAAVRGLSRLQPFKGRMFPKNLGDWRWIDDTYNANPSSMLAAIEFLAQLPEPRLLILGRMGELGPDAPTLHQQVGAYAARAGLNNVLTCGDAAGDYLRGYFAAGGKGQVIQATDHADAANKLIKIMPRGSVLVKGSRSAAMEKVFDEAAIRLAQGELH